MDVGLVALLPTGGAPPQQSRPPKRRRVGLPPASQAVPGAAAAARVRLAAGAVAWARRAPERWFPAQIERDSFATDSHVVLLPLCPPHARESVPAADVRPHGDACGWELLRDQTLRALRPEGAAAVEAYRKAVAALIRKHGAATRASQTAGDASGGGSAASKAGAPLRIGGKPCVPMDPHSRIAMKLRHRVLGKIVDAAVAPGGEPVADAQIMLARGIEAELYQASSGKAEYQNKAVSRIKELKAAAAEAPAHSQSRQQQPSSVKEEDEDEYVLRPEEILLSAGELLLNQ